MVRAGLKLKFIMVKVKFSNSYDAKRKRIKRLPKFIPGAISGYTKRDLIKIKKIFHDGIKDDTLRLAKLAEMTVEKKVRRGFPRPRNPLYGKGDGSEDRSYANMLNITKRGNTWTLYPSRRMHWSGRMKLSDLFNIHEHGAIVRQQRGGKTILISIPPRPALLISYRRFLIEKKKDKREKSKEVKKAMTEYINNAGYSGLKNISDFEKKEK